MNLKESMAREAATVFCNPDEFGEAVCLDGLQLSAVVQQAELDFQHGYEPDMPRMTRQVSVPRASVPDGFEPEGVMVINGESWSVRSFLVDCAFFHITVSMEG